jgi:hypothetical protein
MATDLETLVISLEARVRGYEKEMQRARAATARAMKGIEKETQASTAKLTAILSNAGARAGVAFSTGLSALGAGGVVAGLGLGALIDTARNAAAELAKIGDVAERVNVTAESLQALQFAAEQSGGSAEAVNSGLQKFTAGLADATTGSGDLFKVLKANDVAFTDLNGKVLPTEQILMRFADVVANARTPAEQLEFAIRAFGRSAGPELVGLLSQGAQGVRDLMDDARKAGAVLDNEMIEKARKIDDAFAKVGRTVKVQVGGAIISAVSAMGEFVQALNQAQAASNNVAKAAANIPTKLPLIGGSDVHESDLAADLRNGIGRLSNAGGRGTSYDPNDLTPALGPYTPSRRGRSGAGNAPGSGRAANRYSVLPEPEGAGGKAISEAQKLAESYQKLMEAARMRVAGLQLEQQALGLTAEAAETLRFKQELINQATRDDIELTPDRLRDIDEVAAAYGRLAVATDEAAREQQELNDTARQVMGGFIQDLRSGVEWADALSNALDRIADKLLNNVLEMAFPSSGQGGILQALGLGARASGGPVQAGKTYLVGESGPELVRFGRNGTVKPNSVVKAGGQTGGANYAPVYQIDARGAESGVEQKIMAAIKAYDRQNERTLPARIAEINMRRG